MPSTKINRLSDIETSACGSIQETADAYLADIASVRTRSKNGVEDAQTPQMNHVRHSLSVFLPFMEQRGKTEIAKVKTPDLRAFIAHAKTLKKSSGKPYAPSTVNGWAKDVRALFMFAHVNGFIESQPWVKGMMPPLPKATKPGMSLEEAAALLAKPDVRKPMGVRDRAILAITLDVGPRLNSIAFLVVGDLTPTPCGLRVLFRDPKNGEDHTVTLGRTATAAVQAWLRLRGTEDADARLWVSKRGVLGRSGVSRVLRVYGARIGVKSNPHRYRHTCAQLHHAEGMDVVEIQSLLGHKQLETTLAYMDGLDERAAAAHKTHNALDAIARQRTKLGDLPKPAPKKKPAMKRSSKATTKKIKS